MSKILTLLLTSLSLTLFADIDSRVWDTLKTIRTESYELKIPIVWRQIESDRQGTEQLFEASGHGLPSTYNGSDVFVLVFLTKMEGEDINDCKNRFLSGYRNDLGLKFPKNFNDGERKITLSNGQEAYMLNTRYFRKRTAYNHSRFDMVVYSDKAKAGYVYTLTIQYKDKDYAFETANNLNNFAEKLFSYFVLVD